jgi:hypothetical protein
MCASAVRKVNVCILDGQPAALTDPLCRTCGQAEFWTGYQCPRCSGVWFHPVCGICKETDSVSPAPQRPARGNGYTPAPKPAGPAPRRDETPVASTAADRPPAPPDRTGRTWGLAFCIVLVVGFALLLIVPGSLRSPAEGPRGSPATAVSKRKTAAAPDERNVQLDADRRQQEAQARAEEERRRQEAQSRAEAEARLKEKAKEEAQRRAERQAEEDRARAQREQQLLEEQRQEERRKREAQERADTEVRDKRAESDRAREAARRQEEEKIDATASQQLKNAQAVFDGTAQHLHDRKYQKAHEKLDRAEERCHDLLRDYPDTTAAAKARELLKKIEKERDWWKKIEKNPWIFP